MGQTSRSAANRILKWVSDNTMYIALVYCILAIVGYVFLVVTEQSELTTNLYYLEDRVNQVIALVICYNILPKNLRLFTLLASAIAVMRLFNQILYSLHIVHINYIPLLAVELVITLIVLWRISDYHSDLS